MAIRRYNDIREQTTARIVIKQKNLILMLFMQVLLVRKLLKLNQDFNLSNIKVEVT